MQPCQPGLPGGRDPALSPLSDGPTPASPGVAAEAERETFSGSGGGGIFLKSHQMELGLPAGRRGNSRRWGWGGGSSLHWRNRPSPPHTHLGLRRRQPAEWAQSRGGNQKQKKAEPWDWSLGPAVPPGQASFLESPGASGTLRTLRSSWALPT